MNRKRLGVLAGAAVAAAGLGTGIAVAAGNSAPPAASAAVASSGAGYSWYRAMMSSTYPADGGTGMMMGSPDHGWMMSRAGYQWMTGGGTAPGWMSAGLPASMMGASTDPGQVMGRLWANAPGPRVSGVQAVRLAAEVPAGAHADRAADTLAFTTASVRLAIVASPPGGPDETFRAAGLVNPRIVVPAGARVVIEFVNADQDTAHGLVVAADGATGSAMPMMTARPVFSGAALWFLGDPTPAGMHEGTLAFTAARGGTYSYLCPVPGHSQKGMAGTFAVR